MLSTTISWMQIRMIWLLIILPLVQGSPITSSQFLTQPATTTLSSSSFFPTAASPSLRPVLTATPTTASSPASNNTLFSPSTSGASSSAVTAAPMIPSLQSGGSAGLLLPSANGTYNNINLKFVQTTYWSCVQWPTTMHCGWHKPILDASNGVASPGRGQEGPQRAVGAGVVAGLVGFFLAAA
ncbi:hypothetical protein PG993_012660 [Apiospora rasikravindrae]|uniref:Uncharacterized protein n=1 Tax=Apiospora rasikravindrae TaxID=990691 RepID=A0ABR1S333_9PEZI